MRASPTMHCADGLPCRERGVGLVEIVVVLMILAVIIGLFATTFTGSKRTTDFKLAQGAASSYAEAIESYMADNGQTPPAVGSPAWAATPRDRFLRGPVDVLLRGGDGQPRPYLRSVPEPITNDRIDLFASGGSPASTARASIEYSTNGASYLLLVRTIALSSGDPVLECAFTNAPAPPAGVQRC